MRPTCIQFEGDTFDSSLECAKNAFVRNYRGPNPVHGWLCYSHYADDKRVEKPRLPQGRYLQPGKALLSDEQIVQDILRTERVALAQALYDKRITAIRCGMKDPVFLRIVAAE